MPRALTPRLLPTLLGLAAALALLPGCDARKPGAETASATIADSGTAGKSEVSKGAVPITSSSDEARRLYLEGRALSDQLRAHDARQLFQQAAAKDPSFAMAHYQLALNAATARDFFAHLKQAVALSDKASEGERLMILALQANGNADPSKALEYSTELGAKYPGDERAHFLLGNAYFGQQQYDKAIEQYQKSATINPRFSPVYNSLGYAYRPLGKYDDAETAFKKYIELIPTDPNPYDSYAELLMKTGRFDESIAQYRKALGIDPHFNASRVGIATNLMLQGKHDQALAEMAGLQRDARDDGDRRTAMFTKGVILVDEGRTDAAIAEIERELAFDTRLADSANMSGDAQLIGDILLDAGRADEAARRYQQALSLVDRSSLSDEVKQDTRVADRYNRARVALAKGDLPTAKSEAARYADGAKAQRNAFRIRQSHALLGALALKEKQYDGAVDHLAQANQQDPQVVYWTALAWQGRGDGAKAKQYAAQAANANILPLVTYAFIREKAKKLS